VHAHTHSEVESIKDLNPKLLDEIEGFFEHYNRLKGGEFKVIGRAGRKKARKLLEEASVS